MQRHTRGPNCKVAQASASKSSIFPSRCETYFLQSPTKARPRIKCPKSRPTPKTKYRSQRHASCKIGRKQPGDTSLNNGRSKGHVENQPDDIVPKKIDHTIRKLPHLHSQLSHSRHASSPRPHTLATPAIGPTTIPGTKRTYEEEQTPSAACKNAYWFDVAGPQVLNCFAKATALSLSKCILSFA